MKIAFVICEYNPMQNGHSYHLDMTRAKTNCDKIVCIMSGNVTQRGELSIVDKYTRAKWAIMSGADMVIELPPQYVLTTAKYFALGAIKIANAVKGEKYLSFGSECKDINLLKKVSQFEEDEQFKKSLDENLKQGMGYAKSFSLALENFSPEYAQILSSPNNTLAIEYLRSIRNIARDITPICIERIGGEYHDENYREVFSSASAVRKMIENGEWKNVKKSVPKYVFDDLSHIKSEDVALRNDRLFSLIKYTLPNAQFENVHGIKEGVENRISNAAKSSKNINDFFDNIATKRYTNSYLSRTVLNALIGNKFTVEKLSNDNIDFVNVLAVESNSKDLLSQFDCAVNTKNSTLLQDNLILSADRLYSSVNHNTQSNMLIVKR